MAKRIQMRKARILALQKIAEQKKKDALDPGQPSAPNESDIVTLPKQTVSLVFFHFPRLYLEKTCLIIFLLLK